MEALLTVISKKEMDVLMRKWTKGKLGGKELDRLIKDFLQKEGLSGQENYYAGESGVCISVGKGTSGLYKNTCKKERRYISLSGVYTGGQQDENGRLLCEYWEVAIG